MKTALLGLAFQGTAIAATIGSDEAHKGEPISVGLYRTSYPVSKVVKILENMKDDLNKEAENDDNIDKKMKCWCKTTTEEKEKAIEDAKELVPTLEAKIEARTAEATRLLEEIDSTKEQVKTSTASLETVTENHNKAMGKADSEQDDMANYIKALKKAERKIQKTTEAGKPLFLQTADTAALKEAVELVEFLKEKYKGKFKNLKKASLLTLAQDPEAPKLKTGATDEKSTNEILGVIGEMKITFTKDLAQHETDQAKTVEEFTELSSAKTEEIKAAQEAIVSKKSQRATAEEVAATTTTNKQGVEKDLSANEKYLEDAKANCASHDTEYTERQEARNQELVAVARAIEILHTDESRELFSSLFNAREPSFLQMKSGKNSGDLHKVADELSTAAKKAGDMHMVRFAKNLRDVQVQDSNLDAFKAVIEELDKLDAEIYKKRADEVKQKDSCNERFQANEVDAEKYSRDKADAETLKTTLKNSIEVSDKQIASMEQGIANLKSQLKDAEEERKKETDQFNVVVQEHIDIQDILGKAISVLKSEYEKAEAALLQKQKKLVKDEPKEPVDEKGPGAVDPTETRPNGFKAMTPHRKAGTVLGMLKVIQQDAIFAEKAARKAEKKAIEEFEELTKDTDETIAEKNKSIVDLNDEKASIGEKLQAAKDDITALLETIESLKGQKTALNQECDFYLEHFDVRQAAMTQELEALAQAKSILKGLGLPADLAKEKTKQ